MKGTSALVVVAEQKRSKHRQLRHVNSVSYLLSTTSNDPWPPMARNPFSVYASHFINASTALNKSLYPESETPEPLFFSVTEGSHLAHSKEQVDAAHSDDEHSDLDEDGYPRLVGSGGSALRRTVRRSTDEQDSNSDQYRAGPSHHNKPQPTKKPSDDPYLDDEDLDEELGSPRNMDSMPLIASGPRSPVSRGGGLAAPAQGWLAHFSHSRNPTPLDTRLDSPRSPRSSESSSPTSGRSSDSSDPPPFLDDLPSPPPTRTTLSESLLPRDGISRSLFTLPDPHRIPRRKYNDSAWTAAWCTALLLCGLGFIITLFVTVRLIPAKSCPKSSIYYFAYPGFAPLNTRTFAFPIFNHHSRHSSSNIHCTAEFRHLLPSPSVRVQFRLN